MKKSIAITDLTRMQGERVCMAGYDAGGRCIRPVLPPPGIPEHALNTGSRALVFPSARVEFALLQVRPEPPHTEDIRYDPASLRFIERLPEEAWHSLLEDTQSESVAAIFQQPIHSDAGYYVMDGRGPRSLGTIRPRRILQTLYQQDAEGRWKYRLHVVDGRGDDYWLTVTDLTWRYFQDHQLRQGLAPEQITASVTALLREDEVFLRIGLARGWTRFPDRCYLQITGVHTFPDYLDGKTFADLAP